MHRRTFLAAVPAAALAAGLPAIAPFAPSRALAQGGGAQGGSAAQRRADEIAARVQAFYEQTRTVQARFEQHFWQRVYSRTQSSRGRIAIERPGRIRFDYDQPAGKVLVSDGSTWTMFEPIEGSAGQFVRGNAAAASTSALGFLMGTARLGQFRRTLLAPTSGQPSHTDALELVPRRADPHYRRIRVYVDNTPDSMGVVRRVTIEDPDGNWNRFDFVNPDFNVTLPESTFRYTPPAGARELSAPGEG